MKAKYILTVFFVLLISSFFISCANMHLNNKTRQYGTYRYPKDAMRYATIINVNADNTFTFRFNTSFSYDTSYGTYVLVQDTIYFKHTYPNMESVGSGPDKLIWLNNKMFFFPVDTGEKIVLNKKNIKNSKFYLQLSN